MQQIAQQPTVLIAEPDALVSIDLSDALENAGYQVLGPFATTASAVTAVEQQCPTLAIVDVTLRDGPCIALIHQLRQRGVPFLVHSAHQPHQPHPVSFQGAPWLVKPALPWDVVALCDELSLSGAASAIDEPVTPIHLVQPAVSPSNPFVRKLGGFAALSDADLAMLERISASPRFVASGTDLAREGEKPDGVFGLASV